MNYGIGNNIIPPELQYAFDLQEKAKLEAAMARQQAMNPQPAVPTNSVVSQLESGLNRGISSAPAPNMQFSPGGIIGYAQGGMTPQPAPAAATQLDPELVAFIQALAALKKEEETSFPEEKDLIEQKRNLLLQNTSSRIKQMYSDMDTVPTFKKGGRVSLEDVMSDPENNAGIRALMASLAQAGRDIVEFTGDQVLEMLSSPVARGQNETLGEVGRGALGIAQDMMPDMPDVNIVEGMAKVGRQMPGSNLGDRPVRDAMAEGISSMVGGGEGNNVSPGLAAAQRRRDLRNANPSTSSALPQATSMSQADMDTRELGLETGRSGLGSLVSNLFKGSDRALENRENFNTRLDEVNTNRDNAAEEERREMFRQIRERSANIPSTDDRPLSSEEVARINARLNRNRGDTPTPTPTPTPTSVEDTISDIYGAPAASGTPPSVRGGDLDISREQAFAGMFPGAQASVDDLARRKASMRGAFPEAQAEADRYKQYRETNPRRQPKTGIAGILDKVADVATVLGRGAGASKGYEGAKIVKESQRAREVQNKQEQDKLLRLLQFDQEDRRMANVRNTDQERYVRDYVQAARDGGDKTKTDAQLRAEGAREFRTIAPAYTANARSRVDADKEVERRMGQLPLNIRYGNPEERAAAETRIREEVYRQYEVTLPTTASTTTPAATGSRPALSSFAS